MRIRVVIVVLAGMVSFLSPAWANDVNRVHRGDVDLDRAAFVSVRSGSTGSAFDVTVVIPPGVDSVMIRGDGAVVSLPSRSFSEPPGDGSTGDWSSRGSTPERNGRSTVVGPEEYDLLWSGAAHSRRLAGVC